MKEPTKKDRERMNIWQLCTPGIDKWVEMMVKKKELKIGKNKGWGKNKVFGWVGEDEIVSSIIGYIIYYREH